MRLRGAWPALTLSGLLAVGTVHVGGLPQRVHAQEGVDSRTPSRPLPLGPRPSTDRAPPGANLPGATMDSTPPQIPPFETGIDFKPTSPSAKVTFNLEDAELTDLVRLVSSITGKAFIIPNKTRSIKATVYAPGKVTAAEAYRAFLSILELNGLALVPSGKYLKVVESQGVEAKTIPLLIDENVPAEDRFVTHLYRVNYVASEDVANLLGRFKSAEGNVTAYAPTNTLIITDTGNNIRRMLRIVDAIDIERGGEQLWIEPVHHANASDLAARLAEIFPFDAGGKGGGAAPAAPAPKKSTAAQPGAPGAAAGPSTVGSRSAGFRVSNILPDERTNSLIIMATETAYLRILELIRHLDVPLDGDGGIHVHYLQHGDSEEIAKTLTTLVGGSAKRQPGQAGKGAAAGSDAVFEGTVAITAHEPTNSLVITSSLHDYVALKKVIDRLDSERRQVFIEAVVITLDVNNSRDLGLNYFSGVPDFPQEGSLGVLGYGVTNPMALTAGGVAGIGSQISSAGGAEALSGIAIGIQGPVIEGGPAGVSVPSFGVALAALAQTSDSDVLATPHLLALNNEEAEINIGQNVPLQGNSPGALGGLGGLAGLAGLAGAQGGAAANPAGAAAGLGGLGALGGLGGMGGGFAGSPPRGDVGTRIRITPHINESDEIRLELEEEISDVGAAVPGNAIAFPINRRTAKTQLVVRDQQTVVIGGLMRDQVNRTQKKIPLLGDIPLLGALFRRTTTTKAKSNLLLFLTPYIVRTQADLRAIYERKMRERQEFLDRYFVFGAHDYHPAIDYSRTRGLVAEISKYMNVLAEDRKLSAAMAEAPPEEHIARPAIGSIGSYQSGEDETVIDGTAPPPEAPPPPPPEAPPPPPPPPPAP